STACPGREVLARDELRHHETQTVRAAPIVNRNNVRMVKTGENPCLGEIGLGIFAPGNTLAVRHLDGHVALELVVVAAVNDAETARTKQAGHAVAAKTRWQLAWRRRNGCQRQFAVRAKGGGEGVLIQLKMLPDFASKFWKTLQVLLRP